MLATVISGGSNETVLIIHPVHYTPGVILGGARVIRQCYNDAYEPWRPESLKSKSVTQDT